MTRTSREISLLVGLLHEGYQAQAWHGPSLRAAIRGLDARAAARRVRPGRHNIWEIVVHAAWWKYVVRRRLTGETERTFPLTGRDWFSGPDRGWRPDAAAWRRAKALLEAQHRRLEQAVAALRPQDLRKRSRGSRQTPLELVRGIAAHDIYHAGQIRLIRALIGR